MTPAKTLSVKRSQHHMQFLPQTRPHPRGNRFF
jgi:hypothetical protein